MADVREKLAAGAVCGLGFFPGIGKGRAQFRKLPFKLSDTQVAGIVQGAAHPGHSSHKPEVRPTYYCQNRLQVKTLDSNAPQRLLIVEDDVHMAYLLGYLAEKERFAVETIADGRKARERIDAGDAVDLVLLDVMLPYTDGFELLERLRSNEAWKGVPVIILTSRTREHDAVRALGLGADDYLTKPFSPAELVADPAPDRDTHVKGTFTFMVAALLAALAVFACDPALEATVAAKPDDTDSRDALARSCARDGEPAAALTHYDVLLAGDSNNVDWLLGRSQALVALGRAREAVPLLEKARQIAPAYEDVWRLSATALESTGQYSQADALLLDAGFAFPHPPGLASAAARSPSGDYSIAARVFRSTRATRISPATVPPGSARPSPSTGDSTRIDTCSRACISRSASTRATSRFRSATRAG